MKLKPTILLATFVIALGVLLAAGAASAAVVIFADPSNPTKATQIFDLEVDGTLYDVQWAVNSTASDLYGPYPGVFLPFDTGPEAGAARDAINSALIEYGATAVGSPLTDTTAYPLFNIGFESSSFPIGDVELATTAPGLYAEPTWTALPTITWEYNAESPIWAAFFPHPPEPTGRIGGTLTAPTPFSTPLILRLSSTSFPDPINEDFFDDGPFSFDQTFPGGTNYDVTVLTQPEGQTCVVENGSGDTPADATDVTDIPVTCDGGEPPPEEPVVLRDCPGGAIVGGVYSAIILTDYEDCVINGVTVTGSGGVRVRNPSIFSIINSYVKGNVRVIRDDKSLNPSSATIINNVIDGGNIVTRELIEADVLRNTVYDGHIRIIDDESSPNQFVDAIGNRIKGGNLRVRYNLAAEVKNNKTEDGNIICRDNDLLDASGNEAENGRLRCGN